MRCWRSSTSVPASTSASPRSNSGTAEFGGSFSASSVEANLVFVRSRLALRADVLGRSVLTTLDTGADSTDLNANFADLFPDVVAAGKTDRRS